MKRQFANIKVGDKIRFRPTADHKWRLGQVCWTLFGGADKPAIQIISADCKYVGWYKEKDFADNLIELVESKRIKRGDIAEFTLNLSGGLPIALRAGSFPSTTENWKRVSGKVTEVEWKHGLVHSVLVSIDKANYRFFQEDIEEGFLKIINEDDSPASNKKICFFCKQPTETIKVSDFISYNNCKNLSCECNDGMEKPKQRR